MTSKLRIKIPKTSKAGPGLTLDEKITLSPTAPDNINEIIKNRLTQTPNPAQYQQASVHAATPISTIDLRTGNYMTTSTNGTHMRVTSTIRNPNTNGWHSHTFEYTVPEAQRLELAIEGLKLLQAQARRLPNNLRRLT